MVVLGHDLGASAYAQRFCGPAACECKKFKQILLHMVGFECPHHLMVFPPLNLHSQNDKVPFEGNSHLPKILEVGSRKQPLRLL